MDTFDVSTGYVTTTFAYDKAGNLTFDGVFRYGYDAWNRMIKVTKAYYATSDSQIHNGSDINLVQYDGLGRRIVKDVTGPDETAPWHCQYHYYYNGQSVVETRNGSDKVLKQQVWGTGYVDELVQIGINNDPADTEQNCEAYYWVCQDANYNVLGLVDSSGVLVERYEYTPYGQRTVFFSAGANDVGSYSMTYASRPTANGLGLCEFGHQGLMHDEESGLVYNRARMLHPILGRFVQRDPLGYVEARAEELGSGEQSSSDSSCLYQYEGNAPLIRLDFGGAEWKVNRRNWRATATADGNCDDTIDDLAEQTNMEPSMFKKWLKPTDGKDLPAKSSDKLNAVREFEIPNTVFEGVSKMGFIARAFTGNTPTNVRQILMAKGFYVVYEDWELSHQPWSGGDINRYTDHQLYGIVYFGHGLVDRGGKKKIITGLWPIAPPDRGWLDPAGDGSQGYIAPDGYYDGQFGVLILKSCFADDGGKWGRKASSIAHNHGAVWLGSGFEFSGVTAGVEEAARNAR